MFKSKSEKRSPPPKTNKQTNKQEWRVIGKNCEEKLNAKVEFKGESAKEH